MKTILHPAQSRGIANFGWLNSRHTFSFGDYYDPERVNFGVLRVLNDDTVEGGRGFGTHPHANMEIVSIPLSGALEHRDSTGRHTIIRSGEVQIMSAGTGIQHSEYNASKDKQVKFLQIWILPEKKSIDPRYEQKAFPREDRLNVLKIVVAPDDTEALWINQKAWFHLGYFDEHHNHTYTLRDENNGVYIFVIEGELQVEDQFLKTRDAIGITEKEEINITPLEPTEYLLIEVRM